MMLTLISYKSSSDYTDRCGDSYYHESDLDILSSESEDEIATKWAEYLFKNKTGEGNDYEFTLLHNGKNMEYEYDEDNYTECDLSRERISNLAYQKYNAMIEEDKRKKEEAERIAKAAQEQKIRQAQIANEQAQRAEYERLAKLYGGR